MSSTKQPVVAKCLSLCLCVWLCVTVRCVCVWHVGAKRISLAWPKGYLNVVNVFLRLNSKCENITLCNQFGFMV